jgi:DNA-binding beta-propeller fold protein YncE
MSKHRLGFGAWAALPLSLLVSYTAAADPAPELLPNNQAITPAAARGSRFSPLNPGVAANPNYVVGQAVTTAVSPDGKTLLVMTSGFNLMSDSTGAGIPELSTEFVFVFDISHGTAVQKQVIPVANTFIGLTFSPDGRSFYLTGGKDDNVHTYRLGAGTWAESGTPVDLGHGGAGNGLFVNVPGFGSAVNAQSGGIGVTSDGAKLIVANFENDSISVVDVASNTKTAELDLRPGKIDPAQAGVPGGEFPYGVAVKGKSTAYVSSIRDREVDVVDISGTPRVVKRIQVQGNPNKMILNRSQSRLLVASDNADLVYVIDTRRNEVVDAIRTTAPAGLVPHHKLPTGSSPNSLALSPDERTLYVTNSGSNSVAVIDLDGSCDRDHEEGNDVGRGRVVGLIPTGWFPNSVSVSRDGKTLYVVNGKSNAGPNPGNCTGTSATNTFAPGCPASLQNGSSNGYVWQLTKAGFLTLPTPDARELARLTDIVGDNNGFIRSATAAEDETMEALHSRIRHVIYIVKENRTYDQILGDIKSSNGDASITQFPQVITPNFHALAQRFVNLDNFRCSGEVSQDGWQWSTAARSSDINDKTTSVDYAGRGTSYDSEGTIRSVNNALPTSAERHAVNPINPLDPDLLPGVRNEVELDGPNGEEGAGYIWNAVLRAGGSVRNYGFFVDQTLYSAPASLGGIPVLRDPFTAGVVVSTASQPELLPLTDPYFRSFDTNLPDFWRFKEWEREFDGYVANHNLPTFEMVRFMEDHMGSFSTAIDGVNTPETQQADDDYAVGLLIDKIAHSPYAHDTLIFVLEDDSQDGPDHVDAHRSTAYVAGPFVKHAAIVSTRYTTVNMLRTIEDVLGLEHMNLHDGGVHPMADVFDLRHRHWTYDAAPSDILRTSTTLPLPPKPAGARILPLRSTHDAAWWAEHTKGFDFRTEDRIDAQAFNHVLWTGLFADRPYPTARPLAERDSD